MLVPYQIVCDFSITKVVIDDKIEEFSNHRKSDSDQSDL